MTEPLTTFTKRRDAATPGSIPDVLEMFTREVSPHPITFPTAEND